MGYVASKRNDEHHAVMFAQVTSKGAGLNPNAKVWQEMPAVPSEAPADGTEGSPWSQTNIPEGMQVYFVFDSFCLLICWK